VISDEYDRRSTVACRYFLTIESLMDSTPGWTQLATPPEAQIAQPSAPAAERDVYLPPPYRTLRGYALDPTLAQELRTATVSEILLRVPWERLDPGPRGEYLDVIDYDPAAKCFYDPVDLDDRHLLAQDGLPPSEGTPQFHQQMVYAVASLTIQRFEQALGRKALWAPGPGKYDQDDSNFVPHLRIYPHALREANAYYSPTKIALLFGYFAAPENDSADHVPGGTVFTSLSHDIIAHETAHALLDGMHRRLRFATNPDMVAFHEAFADVVALFQHFTFPEILRSEIATTRGDIRSQENRLGQMASQFGRATGLRGALRDAIGRFDETNTWRPHKPNPRELATELEPHRRGAILVAAIFDAFLSIYSSRTMDLLRLYTGGTGVLPAGAVHPDLVNRLAEEARKAADHVLTMCVRALDYCPPVDLTFGEYLRAVLTADRDLYPEDEHNYRVAFVEAFRQRGIYPRDVRTLSVENLCWRRKHEDELRPSAALNKLVTDLHRTTHDQLYARTRKDIFDLERATRIHLHDLIEQLLEGQDGARDAAFLGLEAGASFEVHAAHLAIRPAVDGSPVHQLIVQLTQTRNLDLVDSRGHTQMMRFEGGSTLIIDLKAGRVDYCIRKPMASTTRRARQVAFMEATRGASLHSTYFGARDPGTELEPFALLHRGDY
jgi:hypothetical protein